MKRLFRGFRLATACVLWLGAGTALAQYARLHDFGAGTDGTLPYGAVTLRGSSLHGMTSAGGTSGRGTLFSIGSDGSGYSVIRSFEGIATDGAKPMGAVTVAWSPLQGTTFYGMTAEGGASGYGTIFKRHVPAVGFGSTTYTLLHSFAGGAGDGRAPYGDLLLSGSTLYGVTLYGGTSNKGVIFKIGTDGTGFSVLHSFTGGTDDGSSPSFNAKLALSGSTLYGVCPSAGANGHGTIFSIQTDGTGYAVIHDFGGAADGSQPYGGVVVADGRLYGMTAAGGADNKGVIFESHLELRLVGGIFKFVRVVNVMHHFWGGAFDGANPYCMLTLSGSTLYGATLMGGAHGKGVAFRINTDGSDFTLLRTFGSAGDGAYPEGGMSLGGATFYGVTREGGVSDEGTLYALTVPQAATPTITPNGGSSLGPVNVTLACATPGATIRYTLDGSTPGTGSDAYTVPIDVSSSLTLKAVGIANGYVVSPVAQADFSVGAWDAGYTGIGGGWRRLAWFGDYVPMGGEGWIWHNKHGFFFVAADATPQSIWLDSQDMGWLWTSSTVYPFLYRQNDGAWLWYSGSTGPRWFRNMTNNTWEQRP